MKNLKKDLIEISKLPLKTSTDCKKLSADIFSKTNENLSTQTLRRILGLVKTDTQPTIKTLDILSRYLGFDSYNSYILNHSKSKSSDEKSMKLLRLLYLTPIQNSNKERQSPIFRTLSKYIYDDPSIMSQLDDDLIFTENFKFYFIEKFPPFDLLFKGLKPMLLKLQEYYKNDIWFCFFIDSFFYLHPQIEFSKEKLSLSYDSLNNGSMKEAHPFLVGRFFGAKITLTNSISLREKYHRELLQFIENEKNPSNKFCILFTYSEFLIDQKLFYWAEELIMLHYKSDEKLYSWLDYGYKEVIKVFLHLCFVENNKKNDAKKIQQFIEINAIPFYFRKYYSWMHSKYYLE